MEISASVQVYLSAMFLLLGLWLRRRSIRSPAYAAAVLLVALASLLLYVAHYVSDYFTAEGINEAVIYHLRYGLQGAGFAEYAGLIAAVLGGVVLCAAALWWLARSRNVRAGGAWASFGNPAALLCVCLSVAIQPASAALLKMVPVVSSSSATADGAGDQALQAEFDSYYRDPKASSGGATRNLVLIYLEGLERSYFDEQRFPGLITGLRALEKQAISFTEVEQVAGTGWTIAGMVASQCGIPLFAPSDGNAMSGMDGFLSAATCLGDLLKRDGYHLVYYGGATLRFAGKGKFYATHGFDEIAGRSELQPGLADAKYVNSWGLFDDTLFELAFDKYAELGRAQRKFALVLLTLDTHHPDGHVSRTCASTPYGDGRNPILNAVRCTDRLVGDFVGRIRNSPWGKDTVIVLASDHLAMQNSAYERLAGGPRRNLLMVLDPRLAHGRRVATPGSMLDVAPTVMPFVGHDAEVGLGTNLMSPDTGSLARAAHIRSRLAAWREPLSRFWAFPRIERYFEVDAEHRVVRIDGRPFSVPTLIEVDGTLQTVIRFPRAGAAAGDAVEPAGDKPFLLVAPCVSRDFALPAGRTCLFAGRDGEFRAQFIVRRTARFSPEAIRRMLGPAA
jgi:phosphoglycerol transferase